MERRVFLSSLGSLCTITFSGCLSTDSDEIQQYTATTKEVSSSRPLHHEATILQSDIQSEEAPLTIEISVTNNTNDLIRYNERREVLGIFLEINKFILLLKGERPYEYNEELGFWQASTPISIDAEIQTAKLSPDETHTQPLVLVGRQTEDLPKEIPAEFAFEVTFTVTKPQQKESDKQQFEWSFSLSEKE
ncbi:hypothetical protein ACFQJ7_14525 [Halovenus rubra]|uniref:Uncharacterized protein n=2 Tax=Halovenus rubra TaxID=869890 RepID=A0ACC7DXS0_9EURY|nr:hypothetical protein [Halovenus rubra]